MKSLFKRAEELAQNQYRKSFDYTTRNMSVAFKNIINREKLPEPQYKDTVSKEEYLTDIIHFMEVIHNNENPKENTMNNQDFIQRCKELVMDYTNTHLDKSEKTQINIDDVFIVWSCKTLQNSKALLSTTVSDGMYYECTLNGDKYEIYFDAYKKWENQAISIG